MELNCQNFDDENVKLEILELRVTNLSSIISLVNDEGFDAYAPIPALMEALALATYALVLAQIEAYYWRHPHLTCRLRTFVTAVLQEGSHQLTDDSMIFYAIRSNLPAEQLEGLMDKLT